MCGLPLHSCDLGRCTFSWWEMVPQEFNPCPYREELRLVFLNYTDRYCHCFIAVYKQYYIYINVIFKTTRFARKVTFFCFVPWVSGVLYIKYIILLALGKYLRKFELPTHTFPK